MGALNPARRWASCMGHTHGASDNPLGMACYDATAVHQLRLRLQQLRLRLLGVSYTHHYWAMGHMGSSGTVLPI